jgi:hypothetical protein
LSVICSDGAGAGGGGVEEPILSKEKVVVIFTILIPSPLRHGFIVDQDPSNKL